MIQIKTSRQSLIVLLVLSFTLGCSNEDNRNTARTKTTTSVGFPEVSTLSTEVDADGDGVSVGPDGNIYISGGVDDPKITRVTPEGEASVFAEAMGSANGSDFDSNGNLYVADYHGNAIRKIKPDGSVSTLAAELDGPGGVYVDHKDNVIVGLFGADFSGNGATVLKISPDGKVSELATGFGLSDVVGVAGDGNGRIFAANWSNGHIFEVTDGKVTLIASVEGNINQIEYSNDYLYLPAPQMNKILRVDLNGQIEEIAGTGEAGSSDGPTPQATFDRPNSCDFSPDGKTLYVYDANTGHVRTLTLAD